jgi:hypothetical protein
MAQFTMRDLFLLIVIVGIGLGWGLDRTKYARWAAKREREWRRCVIELGQSVVEARGNTVQITTPDGDILNFITDLDYINRPTP